MPGGSVQSSGESTGEEALVQPGPPWDTGTRTTQGVSTLHPMLDDDYQMHDTRPEPSEVTDTNVPHTYSSSHHHHPAITSTTNTQALDHGVQSSSLHEAGYGGRELSRNEESTSTSDASFPPPTRPGNYQTHDVSLGPSRYTAAYASQTQLRTRDRSPPPSLPAATDTTTTQVSDNGLALLNFSQEPWSCGPERSVDARASPRQGPTFFPPTRGEDHLTHHADPSTHVSGNGPVALSSTHPTVPTSTSAAGAPVAGPSRLPETAPISGDSPADGYLPDDAATSPHPEISVNGGEWFFLATSPTEQYPFLVQKLADRLLM
ncbi:hypothetical protein FOMPIDRAFT_1056793 [Fomitopsis schrenkii]|uniref:Uncharacterized protein n=1 Tax=Fomitopsis schrenkii TaxID=2126942 RepID=S8DMG2_FOMSC|nr:hypothetical protein FOMPIDRAFT_1056793 [Fomitopsis schrenkii]